MGDVGSVRVARRFGCAIGVENKPRISRGDKSALMRRRILRNRLAKTIWPKRFSWPNCQKLTAKTVACPDTKHRSPVHRTYSGGLAKPREAVSWICDVQEHMKLAECS